MKRMMQTHRRLAAPVLPRASVVLFLASILGLAAADFRVDETYEAFKRDFPKMQRDRAAQAAKARALLGENSWRAIKGRKILVNAANGWKIIQGKVISVTGPGTYLLDPSIIYSTMKEPVILLRHGPAGLVDGSLVGRDFAYPDGTYTYGTAGGAQATIQAWDRGNPCDPPAEVIEAALRQAELQRSKTQQRDRELAAAALAFQLREASNGTASAQYSLGVRYLSGAGVPVNTNLALYWLSNSAAQKNVQAQAVLERLRKQ